MEQENKEQLTEPEKAVLNRTLHLMMEFKKCHSPETIDTLAEGERGILFQLSLHPEGLLSGELSKLTQVGTGRIANALKHLEKDGLVERKKEEKDHRKVLVLLTPKGKKKMEKIRQVIQEQQILLIREIGVEKLNIFLDEAEQIAKACIHVRQTLNGKEEDENV